MQTKFNDFNFWHLTAQFGTKIKMALVLMNLA